MPDWFYRTVARPILFGLPARFSRRFALSFMGYVGRQPFGVGRHVIEFMGHMSPHPSLGIEMGERKVRSPLGFSCWFDGGGEALPAWTQFGVGLIELGPTWTGGAEQRLAYLRDATSQGLKVHLGGSALAPQGLSRVAAKFGRSPGLVILARLQPVHVNSTSSLAAETGQTIRELGTAFSGFVLDFRRVDQGWKPAQWQEFWHHFSAVFAKAERCNTLSPGQTSRKGLPRLFLLLRDGFELTTVEVAREAGIRNWCVENARIEGGAVRLEPANLSQTIAEVTRLRHSAKDEEFIMASGGVYSPADAQLLLKAGAKAVLLDSGVVFTGPGLVKRSNELLAAEHHHPLAPKAARRMVNQSWFWGAILSLAMLLGSVLAVISASTRVLLPYDEQFCGLTREQIHRINPRLLLFMAHDRLSLAGTMITIGILYGGLALYGIRRGIHWARTALLWSAGTGFFSFFLFLGFGYFDPFHGFITAVLFQFFSLCLIGREAPATPASSPDPTDTARWRRGQWGQLLLIGHSVGLFLAGLIIAGVGVLDVLVRTDLEFLQTSIESLRATSARLLPLIAHDRAAMGGMLIAAAIPFLLAALWGLGRGTRWLWWTMLLGGLPAYVFAIGVHFFVGYMNWFHLAPAFCGLGLFLGGLALTYSWMCGPVKE